eukprot:6242503-Prymnesium_polylepis.2
MALLDGLARWACSMGLLDDPLAVALICTRQARLLGARDLEAADVRVRGGLVVVGLRAVRDGVRAAALLGGDDQGCVQEGAAHAAEVSANGAAVPDNH